MTSNRISHTLILQGISNTLCEKKIVYFDSSEVLYNLTESVGGRGLHYDLLINVDI